MRFKASLNSSSITRDMQLDAFAEKSARRVSVACHRDRLLPELMAVHGAWNNDIQRMIQAGIAIQLALQYITRETCDFRRRRARRAVAAE